MRVGLGEMQRGVRGRNRLASSLSWRRQDDGARTAQQDIRAREAEEREQQQLERGHLMRGGLDRGEW